MKRQKRMQELVALNGIGKSCIVKGLNGRNYGYTPVTDIKKTASRETIIETNFIQIIIG
ncbi:hypothetical protein P261_02807 [Lachnospiraceae bacterium TWA4]|nr:hypothetical protein P261_02807 [Lachnospiraceae bacterium TWA4]